jgi:hypothetical protein
MGLISWFKSLFKGNVVGERHIITALHEILEEQSDSGDLNVFRLYDSDRTHYIANGFHVIVMLKDDTVLRPTHLRETKAQLNGKFCVVSFLNESWMIRENGDGYGMGFYTIADTLNAVKNYLVRR